MTNIIKEIEKQLLEENGPLSAGETTKSLWEEIDLEELEEFIETILDEDLVPGLDYSAIKLNVNWLEGIQKHIPSITDLDQFTQDALASDIIEQGFEYNELELTTYMPNLVTYHVKEFGGDWQTPTPGTLMIMPTSVVLVHDVDPRAIENYLPEIEIIANVLYQKSSKQLAYDEAIVVLRTVYEAVDVLVDHQANNNHIFSDQELVDALNESTILDFKQVLPTKLYNIILAKYAQLPKNESIDIVPLP